MTERTLDNSVAVIFQGQGHQKAGMGKDTYDAYPEARKVYEEASDATGVDIATLCFEDPNNLLITSEFAQPALLTMEVADYAVFEPRFEPVGHVAGHSAGEYSAMVISGAMTLFDATRVIKERGRLMDESSKKEPGAMAVIIGVAREKFAELKDKFGVELANDNSNDQRVIAGLRLGVEAVREQISAWGGRYLPLDRITVASHSSLQNNTAEHLKELLESVHLEFPKIPFVSNVSGDYVFKYEDLRANLAKQVTQTVEWAKSIGTMREMGAEEFIEFGPKKTLASLIKRDHDTVVARHFSELKLTD